MSKSKEKLEPINVGTARVQKNVLTGDWLVWGTTKHKAAYAVTTFSLAMKMARTVSHYEATGEMKKF